MDPVLNPYAPGAGTPPPELAGRDQLRHDLKIAMARIRAGRVAKSVILVGLRGVGKTVLLDRLRDDAEIAGIYTVRTETPENRSLPGVLIPQLRQVLLRLSRHEKAKDLAVRGLVALAGMVRGLKLKFSDIEVALDYDPERGLADDGDLESDLTTVLQQVGLAAKQAGTAVVLFLDEMQYLKEGEFGVLIAALHRCAQRSLPVTIIGAGLPQLLGMAGNAKSYAERLFEFAFIGELADPDAREALEKPASNADVAFDSAAVTEILALTHGYPYFLQEWGKRTWDIAEASPIQKSDVQRATAEALAALDESFFRVRFDRTTPKEKRYLRAMAELGSSPHRSGDIAAELRKPVGAVAPLRQSLINKGMIWSPAHGDTAFTVPLFDEFMKRIMPGDDWRND
jgi:predicted nucleotidyltransferase